MLINNVTHISAYVHVLMQFFMPFLIEGDDETVGHYVCFVINCELKRIQYLDNRLHNEGFVFKVAGVLVRHFCMPRFCFVFVIFFMAVLDGAFFKFFRVVLFFFFSCGHI